MSYFQSRKCQVIWQRASPKGNSVKWYRSRGTSKGRSVTWYNHEPFPKLEASSDRYDHEPLPISATSGDMTTRCFQNRYTYAALICYKSYLHQTDNKPIFRTTYVLFPVHHNMTLRWLIFSVNISPSYVKWCSSCSFLTDGHTAPSRGWQQEVTVLCGTRTLVTTFTKNPALSPILGRV